MKHHELQFAHFFTVEQDGSIQHFFCAHDCNDRGFFLARDWEGSSYNNRKDHKELHVLSGWLTLDLTGRSKHRRREHRSAAARLAARSQLESLLSACRPCTPAEKKVCHVPLPVLLLKLPLIMPIFLEPQHRMVPFMSVPELDTDPVSVSVTSRKVQVPENEPLVPISIWPPPWLPKTSSANVIFQVPANGLFEDASLHPYKRRTALITVIGSNRFFIVVPSLFALTLTRLLSEGQRASMRACGRTIFYLDVRPPANKLYVPYGERRRRKTARTGFRMR